MNLFEQEDSRQYFERLKNDLKNTIQNLSDTEITSTNLEKLTEYYREKFYIEPITLYMDKVSSNIEKSKIMEANPFYGMGYRESQYFEVDSCKVNYNIPFSGSSHLLHLIPPRRILTTFNIEGFENLYSNEYLPSIIFSININLHTLENESEPQSYIDLQFNRKFDNYKSMVSYVNEEVNNYNNSLNDYIKQLLTNRKSKADNFSGLMQKLTIPLKVNSQAPSLSRVPLTLKKELKSFPSQKEQEESWYILDKDYSYIKGVISQECNSFEHSPGACQKLNEEEIRDMLLRTLNTHFDSMATGETFSKTGKTDIRIQFKNKAAYIAECKIWHGISEFKKAIEQLFSYTTWKDIKTSLIIFNKDNKDFSSIIDKVKTGLNTNKLKINVSEISKNEWQCAFKKTADSQEVIQLHVILCDINI